MLPTLWYLGRAKWLGGDEVVCANVAFVDNHQVFKGATLCGARIAVRQRPSIFRRNANEAAAEAQNIHRKSQEEEREERRRNSQDTFERSNNNNQDEKDNQEQEQQEQESGGQKNIIDFINNIKNKRESKELKELKEVKDIKENKEIKNPGDNLNIKKAFEFYA